MLSLDIFRNGERLARGGLRKGVVAATLTWVSRSSKKKPDDLRSRAVVPGLDLRFGGLNTARPAQAEHVDWIPRLPLRLGDEILIRVGRASRVDSAKQRKLSALQRSRKAGQQLVRCSFCEKDRPSRWPDGGPGGTSGAYAFICRQCVFLAVGLLEYRANEVLHFSRASRAKCSFCCKTRVGLAKAGNHAICSRCTAAISGRGESKGVVQR
jgi:hypothetical protein